MCLKYLCNMIISPYLQKSLYFIIPPHFPSTNFSANEWHGCLWQVSTSFFVPQCTTFWFVFWNRSGIVSLITFTPQANRTMVHLEPDKSCLFRGTMVRLFGPHQSSNACSHLSKRTGLSEKTDHGPIETDQTCQVWRHPNRRSSNHIIVRVTDDITVSGLFFDRPGPRSSLTVGFQ